MEQVSIPLIGQKIVGIRPMTQKEMSDNYWSSPATVIVLENGIKLYASSDEEGNDAGVIFGVCGKRFFSM